MKDRKITEPSRLLLCLLFIITLSNAAKLPLSKMMMGLKMKRVVDFRSDTITRPNQAMRKAMFEAEVGDDVFREDPTVNQLEERMARMFGKEKALYFPTGTMCNLAAVLSWCQKRGSEMILGDKSHIHIYEQGGVSQFGGVATHILPNQPDGTINLAQIESSIRTNNIHFPTTELIAIENTHNDCGGKVLPISYIEELGSLCRQRNIPLHLDGARIWNAAVATQTNVAKLVEGIDSISACLSKGLGAPAGSVLLGPEGFIERARRTRKALGGGMRQSGILAAAGLQALDDFESGMLVGDHKRARVLGEALSRLSGIRVDADSIQTNIINLKIEDEDLHSTQLLEALKEKGILALPKGPKTLRIVLHRDINDEDIDYAIKAIYSIFEQLNLSGSASTSSAAVSKFEIPEVIDVKVEVVSEFIPSPPLSKIDTEIIINKEPSKEEVESLAVISPSLNNTTASLQKIPSNPSDLTLLNQLNNPYEAAFVCGMSVSDEGFCVFVQGSISDRIAKIAVNPADPLVDGLDREQVESSEAVTLLQLLQGIDVETYLPKDALAAKFNDAKQKYRLKRVMVHSLHPFSASLCGTPRKSNSTTSSTSELLNVTNSVVHSSEMPLLLPSVSSAAADLANTSTTFAILEGEGSAIHAEQGSFLNSPSPISASNSNSGATAAVVPSSPTTAPDLDMFLNVDTSKAAASMNLKSIQNIIQFLRTSNITNALYHHDSRGKEIDIKNSFEAIALSLRHQAVIEVKSDLFQNEQLSYNSLNDVLNDYPKLLQPSILTFEEKQNEIRSMINEDIKRSQRYLEILIRQLVEAYRQQNELKYSMILTTLEYILQRLTLGGGGIGGNPIHGTTANSSLSSLSGAGGSGSGSGGGSGGNSGLSPHSTPSLPIAEVSNASSGTSFFSGGSSN